LARSRRRSYRQSSSQAAAGLLSLALPAPVRGVAGTRLGSKLITVGVPALVAAGLIHINLVNGTPQITLDHEKAAQYKSVVANQLNNFDAQGRLQEWGRSAADFALQSQGQAPYSSSAQRSSYGFPSTQPATPNAHGNTHYSSAQPTASYAPAGYSPAAYAPAPSYSAQNYSGQDYSGRAYGSQNYAPQGYSQTPAATSNTASSWAYQQQQQQQQLAQQRLEEQQRYESELRRYQQWQAQQQQQPFAAPQQTVPTPYTQSSDPYSRSNAPGSSYAAPSASGYAQPTYGAGAGGQTPTYNQGALPNSVINRNRY